MATLGVNGFYGSGRSPDGYWSGIGRLNVRYVGGVIQNRVIPAHLAGADPALIEWVWVVNERRQATAKEIKSLCSQKLRGL